MLLSQAPAPSTSAGEAITLAGPAAKRARVTPRTRVARAGGCAPRMRVAKPDERVAESL